MRLVKFIVAWLDRYWKRRSYNPIFAFAEQLLVMAPTLAVLLLISALTAFSVSLDTRSLTILVLVGGVGTLVIMSLSLYRWLLGYSRSDWQAKQAERHRVKIKAAHAKWRKIFKA